MSEKNRLYGDTAGLTAFWLMAGMGTAMVAGHVMLRALQRMQETGGPGKVMMKGPFGAMGWMFDVTAPAETQAPATAPKKPTPVVEEAEVVAPRLHVVETAEATADAITDTVKDATEAMVAAGERIVAAMTEAAEAPAEALKAVVGEMTEAAPEPEAAAPLYPERPTALAAAMGAADDLKRIKGVGPKLEGVLNGLGYFHFDQIASWGADELAVVDESLGGFSGRATRDDWIGQAKLLAAGGTA